LYVEYPAFLPGVQPGPPRGTQWERAVIASGAFGPTLAKLRILGIHGCRFVPLAAENPDIVVGRVAGFDTAVYGLPKQSFPILCELPKREGAGDVLAAATKLSNFVTGRYAPSDAWRAIWCHVLGWLQPGRKIPEIKWTASVRPSFRADDPLPADIERQSLRRGIDWYFNSRMLVHPSMTAKYDRPANGPKPASADPDLKQDWPYGHRVARMPDLSTPTGDGSLGVLEGFDAKIFPDGTQPVRWWKREDCNGEIAGAMALAGVVLQNAAFVKTGGSIGDWLYFRSMMSLGHRADPKHPAYGLMGWGDVPQYCGPGSMDNCGVYYGDGNARCMLGMMLAAAAIKTDRYDERLMKCLLANLRISGQLGFQQNRIDEGPLEKSGWQSRFNAKNVSYSPHYQANLWACYLWGYRQTGFELFLNRAKTAIRMTMAAYPDRWTWTNGIQQERAKMLLPLAWLVRVEDTPEHRAWLRRMAADLLAAQDPCGAVGEQLGEAGHGGFPPPASNEAYGTNETPLIQTNADAACDLLYTTNFAFLGLHEAAAATGDPFYRDAEEKLAKFLCRIQIRSETHPELDGGWFRAFDFKRWEYWASNADSGWGAWCIESGWTQSWITSVLALREMKASVWDLTAQSKVSRHFARLRQEMLPDAASESPEPKKAAAPAAAPSAPLLAGDRFDGQFFRGEGDREYLELLDISRRMFAPDPQFQSIPMLYTPYWNGLLEGPTWQAWWTQNSYGPTYCGLPFFQEPLVSFVQNSQDLWFDQMGDGKRTWQWRGQGPELVIPDGQLCDGARPGHAGPKQGDGNVAIHDWELEETAAAVVMQAELLLISRDREAIGHYLPLLRRSADFLETRRDPKNNLFLAGPAANLLAPSYAGWKKPDGSYDKAYLAGLSITCIAALDRLIELEKLSGAAENVRLYSQRRDLARKGLPGLMTDEGYFVKSIDPDGVRHGVLGAPRHGYFEAVCNHDAICFRVTDDRQSRRIMEKMLSLPGLRPHALVITNWPGLDDMYASPDQGLWKYGVWVNGGHWTTCEARMVMAYYRLGYYDDARRSMQAILRFAREFRMDNNLSDFGAAVYQPKEPINLCYDVFGLPAAMLRGLFEYQYSAEGLKLLPHIPGGIKRLEQHFPVRFGAKRLFLATQGSGPVTGVTVNGRTWPAFDAGSVTLPYEQTPDPAVIRIALGGSAPLPFEPRTSPPALPPVPELSRIDWAGRQIPVLPANNLPLRIGADSRGENRFVGDIARAQVFRRALGDEEIALLAGGRPGPLDADPDLAGDWRFDAPKDGAFANAAGDGPPARIVGNASPVDSPHGKALRLDGTGYLEIPNSPRLNFSVACTLAVWICPKEQAPKGGRIIDKIEAGGANGYLLDTDPGNSLRLIVEGGAVAHNAKLKPGRWVHVAATADADSRLVLYVDGKRVAAARQELPVDVPFLQAAADSLRRFHQRLEAAGLGDCYEAAHARLAVEALAASCQRLEMLEEGKLSVLAPASQRAADKSYFAAAAKLCCGLERTLRSYERAADPHRKRIYEIWNARLDEQAVAPASRDLVPR